MLSNEEMSLGRIVFVTRRWRINSDLTNKKTRESMEALLIAYLYVFVEILK